MFPPGAIHETGNFCVSIYERGLEQFWSNELQAFVAHIGANFVDAPALLMRLLRFTNSVDARWLRTIKRIETDLTKDALVHLHNNRSTVIECPEEQKARSWDTICPSFLCSDNGVRNRLAAHFWARTAAENDGSLPPLRRVA